MSNLITLIVVPHQVPPRLKKFTPEEIKAYHDNDFDNDDGLHDFNTVLEPKDANTYIGHQMHKVRALAEQFLKDS